MLSLHEGREVKGGATALDIRMIYHHAGRETRIRYHERGSQSDGQVKLFCHASIYGSEIAGEGVKVMVLGKLTIGPGVMDALSALVFEHKLGSQATKLCRLVWTINYSIHFVLEETRGYRDSLMRVKLVVTPSSHTIEGGRTKV